MAKIILALAGEIASGKGSVSEYLVKKFDAKSLRYSTMLRDILDRMHLDQSRPNIQTLSTFLRQTFGNDVMAKTLSIDIKKDKHNLIILDGVRRIEDLEHIKQMKNFYLLYVDTSIENRYKRIIKRDENTDDKCKSFTDFKKENQQESETKIRALKSKAQYVIDNNKDKKALIKQVDTIIASIKKDL